MNNRKLIEFHLRLLLISFICFGSFVFNELFLSDDKISLPSWGRFIMSLFILISPIGSIIFSIYLLIRKKVKALVFKEKASIILPWIYLILIIIYTIWGLNQDYPR